MYMHVLGILPELSVTEMLLLYYFGAVFSVPSASPGDTNTLLKLSLLLLLLF